LKNTPLDLSPFTSHQPQKNIKFCFSFSRFGKKLKKSKKRAMFSSVARSLIARNPCVLRSLSVRALSTAVVQQNLNKRTDQILCEKVTSIPQFEVRVCLLVPIILLIDFSWDL
jgi:hypothetical protein